MLLYCGRDAFPAAAFAGRQDNVQRAGGVVYRAKVGQIQNFAKDKFSETQGEKWRIVGIAVVGIAVQLGCWLSAGLYCCAAPYQRYAGLVR